MKADDRWVQLLLRPLSAPPGLPARVVQAARELRKAPLVRLVERIEIAATPQGVVRLRLGRGKTKALDPKARGWAEQARAELAEYLEGRRSFFTVPVDLSAAPAFQRDVLEVARAIPFGEVRPYRWVSAEIGHPKAARAVGTALGSNPVPLIIPCHRVISSAGGLGGYLFGVGLKAQLLTLERVTPSLVGNTETREVCRLGCPPGKRVSRSQWERESRWVVFASLADARNAGYRPCKVCRPAA